MNPLEIADERVSGGPPLVFMHGGSPDRRAWRLTEADPGTQIRVQVELPDACGVWSTEGLASAVRLPDRIAS